jgi:Kef-type K+ transport system membrane component KefB
MDDISNSFRLPWQNPVLIFSLILFIILLAPVVLNRLKIPGIIGLIVSGMVIGPHGFNILEKGLFVEVFSTVGLLYIMFIAGLELDLNEFKRHRNRSMVFGFFTFIIPICIGFPVCYFLLDYDFFASLLTASMFATHTLVTYPIVSKLRVSKNRAVAVTVGGTILTDTAVLILLAIIVGAHKGNLSQEFWLRLTASLGVFLLIMFYIIPKIAKWFFKTMASEKYAHFIFVLSIVFLAAFLAQLAGVEAIIGAFVAGLALNRLIPRTSVLFNRLEFIGNALFIPFFLISVGMLVDIGVIFKGPVALIIAGALISVAISGKWLAAFLTQLAFKYSKPERQLIFGLSNAHAAATLAIILVGFKEKILDINILNGTIILILVTCVVASFVTERAAKQVLVSLEEDFDSPMTGFGNREQLLLPILNPANMEKALEFAILIKESKSLSRISVLTVVPNDGEAEKNINSAMRTLEDFIKETTAYETQVDVIAAIDYNASSGISRTAKETMADIIILGWPRKARFLDKLVGGTMDILLNSTNKSLFICHFEKPMANHDRLVIIVPPLAELEGGFPLWLSKMSQLAKELATTMLFYCNLHTQHAILKATKSQRTTGTATFEDLLHWESFFEAPVRNNEQDLLVFIAAREGSVSYFRGMEDITIKADVAFPMFSKIVIYP